MKILYIGCVESSYVLLETLLEAGAEIVGVITKSVSNYNSDFIDLTPLCQKHNIKYICVRNINDEESAEFAKSLNAQIAFCFGWSQLIKKEFINIFPKGIVGFHPAELPNNRGRHPIIWTLALGLEQTASTFFMIDEEADAGDIVSQMLIKVEYDDDASSLYQKILDVAKIQVVQLWQAFLTETVERKTQLLTEGNSWRKRSEADGKIDWRMSSRGIYNLVRALTKPYVGAHFIYKEKNVKVWKVREIITSTYKNIEPGKIIAVNKDGTVDVKTADNVIRLEQWDYIEIDTEYL